MRIPVDKFVYTRRLMFVFCAAAIGVSPARAQSSIPPLPALPVTFVFSNCDAGVTFKATITDWQRDLDGNVSPLAASKVVTGTTVTYTYLFWGAFTMTVGQTTQVSRGLLLPDGSTGRPAGGLSITYQNLGIDSIPPATSFLLKSSNANGLGVGTGQATSGLAWTAGLYGLGNLMPNGVLSPLPPISSLSPVNTFIQGDGKLLARPVTSYGACAASPLADLLKLLGDLLSPGKCPCGDPIDIATGNLFEQVDDYQTDGANKLRFTRYYNSQATSATFSASLGPNWRTTYDRYIRIVSPTSVIAERHDGRQLTFTLSGSAWSSDSDVDLKLINSGSTWTLTDSSDAVETYTTAGTQARLQIIRARNGYTQTLQYNSSNQVASITDSFNRSLFFTYNAALLQTVATPDAQTFTYGFTGGRLTSIGYSTAPATSQTYLYENTALTSALTGIVDENGNRYVTWTYDAKGRALSSQHAGGADRTTITYNDTDGSRTITNALGSQSVYKFTTLQKVPKVSQIDRLATATTPAGTMKFTYDANGYVASQTDWNGNLTNYVNDAHGQPASITEAAGTPQARATAFTYHPTLHVPLRVVEPGLTTTFTYDAAGNLLTRTVADTTTTTVPYSTAGQTRTWTYTWSNFLLASIQKPRALGATQLTYDNSGTLTATTNAAGHTTQVTQHLPGGLPQTVVDANGVTTQLTYDARLRLLTRTVITAAGPMTTSHNYDAAGNLLSVTRPDGSTLANTFDGAHRLTGVTDLFNQSVAYTLDALGDRTKSNILDAGGNVQGARSATFDALGRMRQDIGGAGQTTAYAYDANGNALRIIDPLSRVTQRAFDARDRQVRITDPAQGALATAYDSQNRPTSVTDPNGGVTTYVYDGFDEIIQRVSPDSGTTVYRYDPDGNLTQRVDAAGAITNYTYDALDRVLTTTYPGDASLNVTYTYDQPASPFGIGRLTTLADAAGTLTRSYDERGNVLSETRVIAAVRSLTSYTYDAASRIASITYPSGWTAIYSRDLMGRVTAVTAQAPGGGAAIPILTSVGYQPFGPFNALTFANGVTETRTFDLDYRLTNLADAGSSAIQNLAYSYDAANNVSAIADAVTAANSQTFGYDALNRLTAASGGYGSVGYTYDGVGNRLTQKTGAATTTYTYAARTNQLASVSAGGVSQAIGYAKTGDINSFNPAAGTITNLTYNQAGRLASVMAGSDPVARYTYDAFGQRLVKAGASVTLYEYDLAGRLIEEADGQGNPLADYIYLDSLPVATLSPIDGQIYFLHDDRLGTPQAATDSSQNVVWSAAYGPFGEMSTVPGLIVQNLRLPGQEYDADSGLYHNGFRDYAPGWGRYLQSDPAGLAGGMNTYAYVEGNPLKLVDPTGLFDKQYWSDSWNELKNIANQDWEDAESWAGVQWADLKARGPIGYLEHEFPTATSCVIALKKEYDEHIKPWLNPLLDLLQILKGVARENPLDVIKGISDLKKDTQSQPPAPAPPPATPPPANQPPPPLTN